MKRQSNRTQLPVRCLTVVAVLFLMLNLAGCADVTEPTPSTVEIPETESVQLDELTVLPDPFSWFGQGEKWEAEAGPYCGMSFEEYPANAVEAYVSLAAEEFGLERLSHKEHLPGDIFLGDGQSGEEAVRITWAKPEGHMTGFLIFEFGESYTTVPGAIWNGDVSEYAWSEDHWQDCETCVGSGNCPECDGRGFVKEVDLEGFTQQVDCTHCLNGQCPEQNCVNGHIRIGE